MLNIKTESNIREMLRMMMVKTKKKNNYFSSFFAPFQGHFEGKV